MLRQSGLYAITNTVNGKMYVGSTVHFTRRWRIHRSRLRLGTHHSAVLQSSWNKHGEQNFKFAVLLLCAPKDLLFYEQRALDRYEPGYNISRVAGNTLGLKFSAEARAQCSLRAKQMMTPEMRARLSAANLGKVNSPEARAKISAALRGHLVSLETRAKLAVTSSRLRHTPETRAKMSALKKGVVHSEKTRRKISETLKGRPCPPKALAAAIGNTHALGYRHTPEAIAKITTAARNPSAETREKLRAAANKRWAKYNLEKEMSCQIAAGAPFPESPGM